MDLASDYDITRTAQFIHNGNFSKVALQFPDGLLKDSTKVASELRDNLQSLIKESDNTDGARVIAELFVLADTTYGSCCVDEVGASHVDADCVVHYGHTCLSPTSTLPALFVFGKASISVSDCSRSLSNCLSTSDNSVLVLYGLEYAHAMHDIKGSVMAQSNSCGSKLGSVPCFANIIRSSMNPAEEYKISNGRVGSDVAENRYSIGGLTWELPEGRSMEEYTIFWIGSDNAAFANIVLTFNSSEIVRYDPIDNHLVKNSSQQKKILNRRYYLVEKAKDANIVGILVGTLGVAGYRRMIDQMKELITRAGKKAYTLVMGKPNPAKLANFPECDIFVYVSCAQTALLDSKEFLAPVITPFEAILAFNRGSQWTGSYVLEFRDLIDSFPVEVSTSTEARFSFLQGGYVEDIELQGNSLGEDEKVSSLAEITQKTLQVRGNYSNSMIKGIAKSGVEFLSARSYQGLDMQNKDPSAGSFVIGRTGKASGYEDEKNK